jgi:polar amino acid transport system substrate-binding protein
VSGLARVQAAGVLKWGGDIQGGEPYVYDDPAKPGRLVGFEVEIANAIANELGVRAEFVQNDWANLIPSLERGTFDVVMNGLEVTEPRTGRVSFTRPYYVFAARLMARASDMSIKSDLFALHGKKVGTLANSLAFEMLRGSAEPVVYEGVEEPYADLANGRTDAVLLDDVIAARYGRRSPGSASSATSARGTTRSRSAPATPISRRRSTAPSRRSPPAASSSAFSKSTISGTSARASWSGGRPPTRRR